MARQHPPKYRVEARRELVDSLDCIGFKRSEILRSLIEKGYLEGYQNPLQILKDDLRHVRHRRKDILRSGLLDETKIQFISEQQEIFRLAIRKKDFHNAIEASKNVAKGRGFNVDKMVFKGLIGLTVGDLVVRARDDQQSDRKSETAVPG